MRDPFSGPVEDLTLGFSGRRLRKRNKRDQFEKPNPIQEGRR
jgi:hypothetical protein